MPAQWCETCGNRGHDWVDCPQLVPPFRPWEVMVLCTAGFVFLLFVYWVLGLLA